MEGITKTRKFPLLGDIVAMLLLFVVTQLVVGLILNLCGVVAPTVSPIEAGDAGNIDTYMREQGLLGRYNAWVYLLMMTLPIVVMWLYVRLRAGKGVVRIRHSAAGLNPSVVLVGVLWLLSSQILLEPLLLLLPQKQDSALGLGAWACFTAVVSAPILEELLCRGLLFETLHKRWGRITSILLASLFFGLIHFDLSTAIVAVVAGMIFGVLYLRTSSIFATIIVHSINNAMAFTLINFERDKVPFSDMVGGGTTYYVLYGVAALIFVAASVEAYFRVLKPRRKSEKVVPPSAEVESQSDAEEKTD